jgi:hypothetical protein
MNSSISASEARHGSLALRRTGVTFSVVVALALFADAAAQLMATPTIMSAATEIGFPASVALWRGIGALLLISTTLYAIPRTAFLGAILVTGFLGGTIASHVRVGEAAVVPIVIALVLATLAWGGLCLRNATLRTLLGGG